MTLDDLTMIDLCTCSVKKALGPVALVAFTNTPAPILQAIMGSGQAEAPRRGGRTRRRASMAAMPSGNFELPAESSSRRLKEQDNRTVSSNGSTGSGECEPRRARRGRRASMVGSTSELAGSSHSQDSGPDYGYGYGDGAPSAPAPGRRRGRRMSAIGGGGYNAAPAPEVDYGYGDTSTYDDKFGKTAAKEEDSRRDRPRMERSRSKNFDLEDIVTGGSGAPPEGSTRHLGAAPRPGNTMAVPMTLPDVKKGRPRRRASMLGAVGDAVGAVGGAVGLGAKKLDDENRGQKKRILKDRKGRKKEVDDNLPSAGPRLDGERRRQGTMLERFA